MINLTSYLMRSSWPASLAALAALAPLAAHADFTRGAVSATSTQTLFQPMLGAINQSGLSIGYTSGVTDFATFAATASHAEQAIGNVAGTSITGVSSPIQVAFAFDLGSAFDINGLAFFNLMGANSSIKSLTVYADDDGVFGNGTVANLGSFAITVPSAAPISAQVLSWNTVNTRYVTLLATANNAGTNTGYGISEVVFSQAAAVPEPGTWAMALAGLGLLAAAVGRQRR